MTKHIHNNINNILCVCVCVCGRVPSRVQLSAATGTGAHQAPLSMGFSRQEYWSGLPFLFPGDLPDPRIELMSPASPELTGRCFTSVPPGKPINNVL